MTTFGWRPQSSCYLKSDDSDGSATLNQTTTCPKTPVWFYVGLLAAVILGSKKK
jgi:hypothetical protein